MPAEKSLKTMGDEMQVELEDAGEKEAEEKRGGKDGQTQATN